MGSSVKKSHETRLDELAKLRLELGQICRQLDDFEERGRARSGVAAEKMAAADGVAKDSVAGDGKAVKTGPLLPIDRSSLDIASVETAPINVGTIDPANRFASLVAIGLSQVSGRLR